MSLTDELIKVHETVKPFVHHTPVLTSSYINSLAGATLYFKCENFQKMGAFKMRGATNAILNLTKEQQQKGVVTHSSGNFAQAVSLAAKQLGVKAYIVMPKNAPKIKQEAVKNYGGHIYLSESTPEARTQMAAQLEAELGATFIHPSNDIDVIQGNATAAIELLKELPSLHMICTPVGGGGLIAGTALATHAFGKNCTTIGGEPKVVDDAYRSLMSGKIETNATTATIADGLRTHLGDINFPIIQQYVSGIVCVSEDEIVFAMKLIWERMKIIVEPSSAVALAAVLKEKDKYHGQQIGIIISGGNVDLKNLPF